MRYSRVSVAALSLGAALLLAACGSQASHAEETNDEGSAAQGSESASPQDSDDSGGESDNGDPVTALTVVKSGGFAGASETLEISEDGEWSYTKNKMAPRTGDLSDKEREALWEAAGDKAFAEEGEESKQECADVPQYEVVVERGDEKVSMKTDECGTAPNDAFDEIVKVASDATPI